MTTGMEEVHGSKLVAAASHAATDRRHGSEYAS